MFRIEPKDQQRFKQQGKTTLFYVGLAYHAAHKGFPPPVRVKTMSISFPKLGEALILDSVYAEDLVFKTRYKGEPAFVSLENGGQQMAEYIKEQIAAGISYKDMSPAKLEEFKAKKMIQDIPDDVLIEALRQRKDNLPEELLLMLKDDRKAKTQKTSPEKEGGAMEASGLTELELEKDRLRKPKEK